MESMRQSIGLHFPNAISEWKLEGCGGGCPSDHQTTFNLSCRMDPSAGARVDVTI
jgi:hypothetical protein